MAVAFNYAEPPHTDTCGGVRGGTVRFFLSLESLEVILVITPCRPRELLAEFFIAICLLLIQSCSSKLFYHFISQESLGFLLVASFFSLLSICLALFSISSQLFPFYSLLEEHQMFDQATDNRLIGNAARKQAAQLSIIEVF